MKVRLGQAVKMFFGNSSLEMVFFEAIANALDAGATRVKINISATAYNQPQSLNITIADNGDGFTDERFKKFSNLFDVEESSHKGLGRLVYLCYFENVKVDSFFDSTYKREFEFNEDFKEEEAITTDVPARESGTVLSMTGYTLSKLKAYNYIQPKFLKERILEEFYSRLYELKESGVSFDITIISKVEGREASETLSNDDFPSLEMVRLDSVISLVDKFYLYYSIEETEPLFSSFTAAISVDNRTIKVDIVSSENIPIGYKMVFLLYSDWFTGKVDASRQILTISESDMQSIQTSFRNKVASIIEEEFRKLKNEIKRRKIT